MYAEFYRTPNHMLMMRFVGDRLYGQNVRTKLNREECEISNISKLIEPKIAVGEPLTIASLQVDSKSILMENLSIQLIRPINLDAAAISNRLVVFFCHVFFHFSLFMLREFHGDRRLIADWEGMASVIVSRDSGGQGPSKGYSI